MLRHLDLFSGIGGFALAARMVGGYETVGFCEIEPYCQAVLRKHWPGVPIYDDVRTLFGHDTGPVDIITGGFPCQDISNAGKRAGIAGERSGLWAEACRIIGELRPEAAVMENVSALLVRGLDRVLGDLAEIGYDAEWHCVPAAYIGAPHNRDRAWIVAYPHGEGLQGRFVWPRPRLLALYDVPAFHAKAEFPHELPASALCRGSDGISARMDRTRAIGNAIVPQVAAIFLEAIKRCHDSECR